MNRIAWYCLLYNHPHSSPISLAEGSTYAMRAFELGVCRDESYADCLEDWVANLEAWWRAHYVQWLTKLGQGTTTRSNLLLERAKEAFESWRGGQSSAALEDPLHVDVCEANEKGGTGARNRRKGSQLPHSKEEFTVLGFAFDRTGMIAKLPYSVRAIMEDVLDGGKRCEGQSAFILCVLNAIARGEHVQYFLTGRAWTGKSYVFGILRDVLEDIGGKVLVLAPTAVLAPVNPLKNPWVAVMS